MDLMAVRRRLLSISNNNPPNGYRFIEYAKNEYHAYVELPYGFDVTDSLEIKAALDASQGGEHWMCGPKTWNNNTNRLGFFGASNRKFMFAFGAQGTPNNSLIPAMDINSDVHTATYGSRLFRLDESEMDVQNTTFGGTTTNLRLFNGYAPCIGKIYYFKQSKTDGDKLYVVPIQHIGSGTVEMYDTVSKTIMARTGTLLAPT